jgi:hypothetical protein
VSTASDAESIYEALTSLEINVGLDIDQLAKATNIPREKISFALSHMRRDTDRFPLPYVVTRAEGTPVYLLARGYEDVQDYLHGRFRHGGKLMEGEVFTITRAQELPDITYQQRRKLTSLNHHLNRAAQIYAELATTTV